MDDIQIALVPHEHFEEYANGSDFFGWRNIEYWGTTMKTATRQQW